MGIKSEIPITNKNALEEVWQLYGIAMVKQAIEGCQSTAPGFALAAALVEAQFAEARARVSGEMMREAARAGYDIGRSLALHTAFKKGQPVVEIEMPDLGDEP